MEHAQLKTQGLTIISELYYPEQTSTGYILTEIAESLATSYSVSVVTVQPTYSARGVKAPSRETHNGVAITRVKATNLNKDKLLAKLINWLTISLSIFLHLLLNLERNQCVLVVTNPPILPFLTAIACRLKGAKYMLLIHDVYPDVLIATGYLDREGLIAKISYFFSSLLYRKSDHIVVLGRDMERIVLKRLEDNTPKVSIIPNWCDVNKVYPTPKLSNTFITELGLQKKFVIQYSGNMGHTHGLEVIVDAAIKLKELNNVQFLLCGSGAKKQWIKSIVTITALNNIVVLPSQPKTALCELLNSCDVAIISFMPGMAGISVPSRMYNIMAAGKPIIAVADADSELALVVAEEQIGWVVPPNNSEKLAEVIYIAMKSEELIKAMGEKARRVAETKYNTVKILDCYHILMQQALGAGRPSFSSISDHHEKLVQDSQRVCDETGGKASQQTQG